MSIEEIAARYSPDFSEADTPPAPIGQSPGLDSAAALHSRLSALALVKRVRMGHGTPGDYLQIAARAPGHILGELWDSAVSGATLPGDVLRESHPPGVVMDYEPVPQYPALERVARDEELLSRTQDLAGLATVGGGLSHGLAPSEEGMATLRGGLHPNPREAVGVGAAEMAGERARRISQFIGDDPYNNSLSVNPKLRSGEPLPPEAEKMVSALDSAIREAPRAESDTLLYRGVPRDYRGGLDPAFVHTSRDQEVAAEFADNLPEGGKTIRILASPGTPTLDVTPYHMPGMRYQRETVLPRGGNLSYLGNEMYRYTPPSTLYSNPKEAAGLGIAALASRQEPLYSHAERVVEAGPAAASPEQWIGTLRNKGTRTEELEPIEAWLRSQGKPGDSRPPVITRDELAARVREARPQIQEVWKNSWVEDPYAEKYTPSSDRPRFSRYQVPGGERYRELLLKLPTHNPPLDWKAERLPNGNWSVSGGGQPRGVYIGSAAKTPEDAVSVAWQEYQVRGEGYVSPHWPDDPNTLAHVRMNDRYLGGPHKPDVEVGYDPDSKKWMAHLSGDDVGGIGDTHYFSSKEDAEKFASTVTLPSKTGKTLNVEEFQSDLHQAGRKSGYQGDDLRAATRDAEELQKERTKLFEVMDQEARRQGLTSHEQFTSWVLSDKNPYKSKLQEMNDRFNESRSRLSRAKPPGSVPDAPFKKTWPELLLKRMVVEAVRGGYDNLSWTDGATQADRYDLSKHVDHLYYSPETKRLIAHKGTTEVVNETGVTPEKLQDYIGKEAADRLLNKPTRVTKFQEGNLHELTGSDLKVGGEGMRGFYDTMLPRMANKLFGRWGARVEQRRLPTHGDSQNKYKVERRSGDTPYVLTERDSTTPLGRYSTADEAWNAADALHESSGAKTIHVLPITPELRQQATQHGFSLFSNPKESAGVGAALLAEERPPLRLEPPQNIPTIDNYQDFYHQYPNHADHLTYQESRALQQYSDGFYRTIADYIYGRRESVPSRYHETMGHLDALLGKSEVPENLVLWHGASSRAIRDFDQLIPGKIFVQGGYLSTSLSYGFAKSWKRELVKIVAPRGSRGLVLGERSEVPDEHELLLPRQTHLFYSGRDQDGIHNFTVSGVRDRTPVEPTRSREATDIPATVSHSPTYTTSSYPKYSVHGSGDSWGVYDDSGNNIWVFSSKKTAEEHAAALSGEEVTASMVESAGEFLSKNKITWPAEMWTTPPSEFPKAYTNFAKKHGWKLDGEESPAVTASMVGSAGEFLHESGITIPDEVWAKPPSEFPKAYTDFAKKHGWKP